MSEQNIQLILSSYLERFFNEFTQLVFDQKSAQIAGEIRLQLERKGTPIGSYDLQIAAVAIANNLTLVTHNIREFGRMDQLNKIKEQYHIKS